MEGTETVRKFIASLNSAVDLLEVSLEPVLKKTLDELVTASTTEEQINKVNVYNNFLYTLIATLFSYMKSIGVNTDTHPITSELTRIKSYMNRAKSLGTQQVKAANSEEQRKEESKAFLQNVLGGKQGGSSATTSMSQPAISSVNFKGKHTKFENDDSKKSKVISSRKTPAKITKPRMKK